MMLYYESKMFWFEHHISTGSIFNCLKCMIAICLYCQDEFHGIKFIIFSLDILYNKRNKKQHLSVFIYQIFGLNINFPSYFSLLSHHFCCSVS